MPTERCTELIMKGLYYDLDEMWVSEQPFLAMTYIIEYMPYLSRKLMVKYFGPARINALKNGLNIYDAKVMIFLSFCFFSGCTDVL
jgi:dehydrogenase/reductase SDR family protein 7